MDLRPACFTLQAGGLTSCDGEHDEVFRIPEVERMSDPDGDLWQSRGAGERAFGIADLLWSSDRSRRADEKAQQSLNGRV